MTKKDYELFAYEIHWRLQDAGANQDYERQKELGRAVEVCASVFERDNPLFNREKFFVACFDGKHIRKAIRG